MQGVHVEIADWGQRAPLLVMLLGKCAPGLQSLELRHPRGAPPLPYVALPVEVGLLSQLTSLRLDFGDAPVTAAQVRRRGV